MKRCSTAVVVLLMACGGSGDGGSSGAAAAGDVAAAQDRDVFPAEGMAHLDSGNEAYREDRVEDALEHYREAIEIMPQNAASWYGVYMAATELGMTATADSARAKVREIAPGMDPGPGSH